MIEHPGAGRDVASVEGRVDEGVGTVINIVAEVDADMDFEVSVGGLVEVNVESCGTCDG